MFLLNEYCRSMRNGRLENGGGVRKSGQSNLGHFAKVAVAAGTAILLSACVTATQYAPATAQNGYGFSEQRIESNRYRIMFRGNSSTSRETVENFLLYRAAELTLINGYDHFIVFENDTEANRSTQTTSSFGSGYGPWGPAYYGRYRRGFGYAFPYYAWGWGWGAPVDSYTREITRYSAVAFVTMHEGPKPADDPRAFSAREVADNLRPFVLQGRENPGM